MAGIGAQTRRSARNHRVRWTPVRTNSSAWTPMLWKRTSHIGGEDCGRGPSRRIRGIMSRGPDPIFCSRYRNRLFATPPQLPLFDRPSRVRQPTSERRDRGREGRPGPSASLTPGGGPRKEAAALKNNSPRRAFWRKASRERCRNSDSSISLIVPFMPSSNRSFGSRGS